MTPPDIILPLWLSLTLIAFAVRRLPRLLQFFQQEEYDGTRFIPWLARRFAFDTRAALALALFGVLYQCVLNGLPVAALDGDQLALVIAAPQVILGLAFLFLAWRERAPRVEKKPLVWTNRAKRIYAVALALAILPALVLGWPLPLAFKLAVPPGSADHLLAIALWAQALPLLLVLATLLLWPYEAWVRRHFRVEAQARLAALAPTIVAITGSFGKTSAKHILAHILSGAAPTLATPGSINTLMGIARIIREKLRPEHRFFLVEMGAYRPGSIARLCRFTPPDAGIITAVGAAHYERFRDLATVARAKFELARAVWGRGGTMVLNASQIDGAFLAQQVTHLAQTRLVGTDAACAYRFHNVSQNPQGLALALTLPDGETLALQTPLFGTQHAANIACAAALALELGVPRGTVLLACKTLPQITHRLEVKRFANTATVIDDAYNSNPVGFEAALDVLNLLGRVSGGRRIVVTPGMTELGALHEAEHARLGSLAAQKADWIIAVRPDRIASFVAGAKITGAARCDTVPTLAAARTLLAGATLTPDDIVLYENDLPELYEARPRF